MSAKDASDKEAQPAPQSGEPVSHYEDGRGRLVPAHLMKQSDLLEDQFVSDVIERALALSRQLSAFKREVLGDVDSFVALLAEKHSAKRGGAKGNITLSTFDERRKIQVAVADRVAFGPELQIAKTLVDECIEDWGKDSADQIKLLVQHAFRTDKEGQVSRESVFSLLRIEGIDDPRWTRAMEAITASIRVVSTSTYLRFYRRDPNSGWVAITLDLASA